MDMSNRSPNHIANSISNKIELNLLQKIHPKRSILVHVEEGPNVVPTCWSVASNMCPFTS